MTELGNLQQAVGELRGTVGALKGAVETLTVTWAEQDRKANDGRRELYRKVDTLGTDITKMGKDIEFLSQEVSEIKPAVRTLENRGHQTRGAKAAMGLLWGALLGGVGAIAYVIHDLFAVLWPPKGH